MSLYSNVMACVHYSDMDFGISRPDNQSFKFHSIPTNYATISDTGI